MKTPKVHILATCRNPELLPATTLVFKTLRKGFPTANITVWDNNNNHDDQVLNKAYLSAHVDDVVYLSKRTIHHKWIERLLKEATEPFYIVDTDLIFWDSVESWDHGDAPLAGRIIPKFYDQFTQCITKPRLHTSLLWMNPDRIAEYIDSWKAKFPVTPFNPIVNLIHPLVVPFNQADHYFFDTTSLLYQVTGGQHFIKPWLDHYDHLNFGTISDIVAPHYPDKRFREAHFAIFENNELARGLWKSQERFYQEHAC